MKNKIKEKTDVTGSTLISEPNCKSEPEFKVLCDWFTREIMHNIDLSNEIYRYANTLKPIFEKEKNPEVEQQNPQGVIHMFQNQVWQLEKSNAKLVTIANHLRGLIGN